MFYSQVTYTYTPFCVISLQDYYTFFIINNILRAFIKVFYFKKTLL